MSDVTRLMPGLMDADVQSTEELLPLVYDELRKLAAHKLAGEPPGQTLQATALVHEAWLRVRVLNRREWANRGHFFTTAAEAMRRILVDNARRKLARRHGGGHVRTELSEDSIAEACANDEQLLRVHEALERLAVLDPEKAQLVKLRYFVGFKHEEIADVLKISIPTVKRHWAFAKAWLYREIDALSGPAPDKGPPTQLRDRG